MHIFGTEVDPRRPPCRCLIGKPGPITSEWLPHDLKMIDLDEWPLRLRDGFILVGIDCDDEPALRIWEANHHEP